MISKKSFHREQMSNILCSLFSNPKQISRSGIYSCGPWAELISTFFFLPVIPSYKNSLASDKCSEFNWIAALGDFICHRYRRIFLVLSSVKYDAIVVAPCQIFWLLLLSPHLWSHSNLSMRVI